mgnify:CR=1 FL=1
MPKTNSNLCFLKKSIAKLYRKVGEKWNKKLVAKYYFYSNVLKNVRINNGNSGLDESITHPTYCSSNTNSYRYQKALAYYFSLKAWLKTVCPAKACWSRDCFKSANPCNCWRKRVFWRIASITRHSAVNTFAYLNKISLFI